MRCGLVAWLNGVLCVCVCGGGVGNGGVNEDVVGVGAIRIHTSHMRARCLFNDLAANANRPANAQSSQRTEGCTWRQMVDSLCFAH